MGNTEAHKSAFQRLLIQNVVTPLLLGIFSAAVFVGLILYLTNVSAWVDHTDRVISKSNAALRSVVDLETGLRGFVITKKENFLEPYQKGIERLPHQIAEIKKLVADNAVQTSRLELIEEKIKEWIKYSEEILEAVETDKKGIIGKGRGKAMTDEIRVAFDEFLTAEERLREARTAESSALTKFFLFAVVLLTLSSKVFIAFMGRRQLKALAQSYDEVLSLQSEQNRLLQEQQWIKTGETLLTEQLAGENSLKVLADSALRQLSPYVNASVGALYAVNENGVFERVGSYGFPQKETRYERFKAGEGLLGQAILDRKIRIVENLPEGYIKVGSVIGETAPKAIALVPLISENVVNGALELAFLTRPEPKLEELLAAVSEGLSMAVKSAKYRERLELALREVQNQAEELQSQQEELRVNNEELEEQAKILKETQSRLEAQHAELEQTNAQLEEQTQMLETQKDNLNQKNEALNRVQATLKTKATELQMASQYKSEFLANMSHELRTPLNSSLILAKLLSDNKDRNLTPQQVEYAQQITSSGNDLLNLINDILDLSKVEAGKLEISASEINLAEMVSALERSFKPVAAEKKLKLSMIVEPDAPMDIFSDRQRLEQVLRNLISNALKFTMEGSVELRVRRSLGSQIEFAVKDTGIGISPDKQEVIFEAFRQADGTTNRRFGGTGLGLSISRDLAKLLGGSIRVESALGEGSCFKLFLPEMYEAQAGQRREDQEDSLHMQSLKAAKARDFLVEKRAPQKTKVTSTDDREKLGDHSKAVLVVEDDRTFAKILYDLAQELGFQCVVAETVGEALDLIRERPPQAVLLDMNLPDHSGLVVLDHMKQDPKTRHIPVHVVSAEEGSQEALEMGAVGYLVKPAQREKLKEAFGLLESKIGENIRRVLVVEDDQVQRDAIRHLIQDPQIEIQAVGLGEEALALLQKSNFDCMIIDLNLPDMSGFDLLQKMSEDDSHSYPPVIVYTGRDLSRDEEDRLRRYSQSVIVKGAKSPERLLNEVTLFLHRVESQLDPQRQKMLEALRSREKIFESKRILLVDDDMRNVFALTAALEQKGAKISIAKNGEEALKRLEEDDQIDLVLMDIMMPIMNGYRAMEEIRKQRKFARLPIIALTAKAMKDDRELCLKAGANDYLAKPVDVEKLLSLIRVWVSTGGRR